jgi:hypothetical protein
MARNRRPLAFGACLDLAHHEFRQAALLLGPLAKRGPVPLDAPVQRRLFGPAADVASGPRRGPRRVGAVQDRRRHRRAIRQDRAAQMRTSFRLFAAAHRWRPLTVRERPRRGPAAASEDHDRAHATRSPGLRDGAVVDGTDYVLNGSKLSSPAESEARSERCSAGRASTARFSGHGALEAKRKAAEAVAEAQRRKEEAEERRRQAAERAAEASRPREAKPSYSGDPMTCMRSRCDACADGEVVSRKYGGNFDGCMSSFRQCAFACGYRDF